MEEGSAEHLRTTKPEVSTRSQSAATNPLDPPTPQSVRSFLPSRTGIEWEYPFRLVAPANWVGHIPFAFWLVDALRPRTIVELGVHTGNSYLAFLQAVQTLGLDTRCFGIDHWKGDEHAGFYGDEIFDELRTAHDPAYGAFSSLLRCSFEEGLAYFSEGSIDLLHIDGFHTYEAISSDFRTWLPKMSPRGVVLLHDTNVKERGFGIWRFWEEIAERYPAFEFHHCYGLGVAFVGSERPPDPINLLTAAPSTEEIKRIRTYFSRLGGGLVDRYSVVESARSLATFRVAHDAEVADAFAQIVKRDRLLVEAHETQTKTASELAVAHKRLQTLEENAAVVKSHFDTQTRVLRQQTIAMAGFQREANEQLDTARQQLQIARQQLQGVVESRSWHITAPIRSATSVIRHLKRSVLG